MSPTTSLSLSCSDTHTLKHTLSNSQTPCALVHHTQPLSVCLQRDGGKTRQESVCALLREFTAGLFGAKSNMESLTSRESTHFCRRLASLRFCLWRQPIRQLCPPPCPSTPGNKDPSSPQIQEINKKSSARLHQGPSCFFSPFFFLFLVSFPAPRLTASDLKLADAVSMAKRKALCHGLRMNMYLIALVLCLF